MNERTNMERRGPQLSSEVARYCHVSQRLWRGRHVQQVETSMGNHSSQWCQRCHFDESLIRLLRIGNLGIASLLLPRTQGVARIWRDVVNLVAKERKVGKYCWRQRWHDRSPSVC